MKKIKQNKSVFLLSVLQFTFMFSTAQTFTKITTGPVVNTPGDSRSVNWIDVNNDGHIDLFISNGLLGGQNNMLYINNGAGSFTSVSSDTIVKDNQPSDGATFADCDNDGDIDSYVVNWFNTQNLFYTNNGSGTFSKVAASIDTSGGYCETASWGDFDNDGLLDLYVARSGGTVPTNKNLLFHNNGGNTFTKILTGSLVTDTFISRCVNWTDIDSDGDVDLFITNEDNENENIYRNDSSGIFTKIITGALVTDGGKTMSGSWGDYDNDGDLDVFLANDKANNALFRNDGNFNFTKIITDTVSNSGGNSFSSAWSDIDNDGDLDLFVTNAFSTLKKQLNFLYLNNGNSSFTRVGNTSPATDSSWSYGCAFGDYDNDGFEDLAVATVRFNSVDETDFLYHNDGNSNHWLTIKLNGTISNKSAIGTKIRIKCLINGIPVWQLREISSQTSYCGQNDLRAHFGLGNSTLVDSIKIEWPAGTTEYFTNIPAGQFIKITEGQGITGFKPVDYNNEIKIYPNPTTGRIRISSPEKVIDAGSIITISDIKGNVIYQEEIKRKIKSFEIDSNELGARLDGVYVISLKTNNGQHVNKIIKY